MRVWFVKLIFYVNKVYKMFEVKGEYCTAKVFTDVVEDSAVAQIRQLCNQEFVKGAMIRIMPDVHAGAGCTIGTTMKITDKVVPNLVGVDIGCGMEVVQLKEKHIEVEQLDKLIYAKIPAGFNVSETEHRYNEKIDLTELRCFKKINYERARLSLGSLGGGNHFIEADKGSDGSIYIVVHSGSRHLGVEVANYYQNMGFEQLNTVSDADLKALITDLKAQGREREISAEIAKLKAQAGTTIPKALAYVSGQLFEDYIHDMQIVQEFATLNRKAIMDEIVKGIHAHVIDEFTTRHNYIDLDCMILRKGAVSAKQGEKLIIPMNMRDGSLLCIGKGNADWNYSAP